MTSIRPLEERDLDRVGTLYAELDKRDPALPAPGYADFWRRVILEAPLADPEIQPLVYDDPDDGVVAFLGAHSRPFLLGERPVRIACGGPLVVREDYRPRGIGAVMLRRFATGPQDATINDRMVADVRTMWTLMGGEVDTVSSIGWAKPLLPLGAGVAKMARRFGRSRVPGLAGLASLRAAFGPDAEPPAGEREPLSGERLRCLLDGLGREFSLRPAYDDDFLGALFAAMETAILGDLVARAVRTERGDVGAYVMYVAPGGLAEVLTVVASERDAGLVLDHVFVDARERLAVEVRGRLEPFLYPHLCERGCRLHHDWWTLVHSRDDELRDAVLGGRSLFGRFDGEWWMRPDPEAVPRRGTDLRAATGTTASAVGFAPTAAMVGGLVAELPI